MLISIALMSTFDCWFALFLGLLFLLCDLRVLFELFLRVLLLLLLLPLFVTSIRLLSITSNAFAIGEPIGNVSDVFKREPILFIGIVYSLKLP